LSTRIAISAATCVAQRSERLAANECAVGGDRIASVAVDNQPAPGSLLRETWPVFMAELATALARSATTG
jgi:hypothetical protein